MADVFISYKSERVGAVQHLADILQAHGYTVWFDIRGLAMGPSFGPQIERALREATVVLVLWCSLSGKSDWVIEEADLAKELETYFPAHMEKGVKPPLGDRTKQALQLQAWSGDPDCTTLDALFDLLETKTGKDANGKRSVLREIKDQWELRGRPNFLGETLQEAPSEAKVRRVWSGVVAKQTPKPTATIEPIAPSKPSSEAPPQDTPSARVWEKIKNSDSLHDFDAFLQAFPNAQETEECTEARGHLVIRLTVEALNRARKEAFDALPRDQYDVSVFDGFISDHRGTEEAFEAARLRKDCEIRLAALPIPDDDARQQWELEAAVQIVMGEPIPAERRQFLQMLEISGSNLNLFKALKEAGADLSEIYIDPDAAPPERKLLFSDLAPLKELAQLVSLDCARSQVSDLTPIKDLTQLTALFFRHTQISDLIPIKDLTQLTALFCEHTQISDLTPIKDLTQLTTLCCEHTQISDLTPIKDLTQLTTLFCRNTQVTDWSPVDHIDKVYVRPKSWKRKPR